MEQLEYQEGRTEIAHLGKVPLIRRLTTDFPICNPSTLMGVGDDCAVVQPSSESEMLTLITTQTLVEGVNFDMMYTPLRHLGYKSAAIAASNIAAMNGTPRQLLVSIAVSNRYSVEALDELYAGILLCCKRYGIDLVGGNTETARAGMTLTVTAIGEVSRQAITYRRGAALHDLVCCTGDLGSAYAGLLILEREKVTYQANPNFQPDLASYDYVLERFLKPEPRLDIIQLLAEKGIVPTAMTDISKGLADAALHLCEASHCGCEIYEEHLPIDYQTSRVCSEMSSNLIPVSCALNGGDDYELLFTISQKDYDKVKSLTEIHIIGHITEEGMPASLVTPQNTTITLRAQAFQSNQP
ncbi:MAG: thiamine-phosphate kinase [Bacteroidales bacterium]|nr:thiamine-phosphate kinase [Bacteroidales bacterium]